MFENEGTENVESTQSDVTETPSESQDGSQPVTQESAPKKSEEPRIPYERFQEMVAKRQEAETRMQQYEQRMAEMDRRFQEFSKAKTDKKDPLVERLMGIDEEFGKSFGELKEQASLAKQLQEQLNSLKEERLVEGLKGRFDDLASKSSLTPAIKELYFAKMDAEYRAGNLRSVDALEKTFKAIHEPYAKHQEELKRQAIEEYTKAKKADASKPAAQPKGKAPTPGKFEPSKDPAEAAKQRKAYLLAQLRASREV